MPRPLILAKPATHPQVICGGDSPVDANLSVLAPRSVSIRGVLDFLATHPSVLAALHPTAVSRWALRIWVNRTRGTGDLVPLLDPATLADVAANAAESLALTLELRNADGSWPRGPIPFPTHVNAVGNGGSWTAGMREGSFVDAKDDGDVWYPAQVSRVTPGNGIPGHDLMTVHFFGWSSAFDATYARGEEGRFAPLFSLTRPWHHGVRPGDRIEVRNPELAMNGGGVENKWYLGWVLEVDHARLPPMARVLLPQRAVERAYFSRSLQQTARVRNVCVIGDDVLRVGSRVSTQIDLKLLQGLAPPASPPIPAAPACLPYTEAENARLEVLRELDSLAKAHGPINERQ